MFDIEAKAVGSAAARPLSVVGFRNQAMGFSNPLSGEGARRFGGRFNPPQSYPVVYLCTTVECSAAELLRQAKRQNLALEALLPRELWRIEGELSRVLDLLDKSTLEMLGVARDDLIRNDLTLTRQIGESAYEHQFQAVLAPSATEVDQVIAVFIENLAGAVLEPALIGEWKEPQRLPA